MVEERCSEHQQHIGAFAPRIEQQARDEEQRVLALAVARRHRQQQRQGQEEEEEDRRTEDHRADRWCPFCPGPQRVGGESRRLSTLGRA